MNGKWIATRQLTAHPEEAACSQRPSRRVPVTSGVQRSLALLARISILALLLCLVAVHRSAARTLEEALISTFPGPLSEDAQGLATVFSRTVAASFPVTGASAAYVYRFDPATDSFQRLNIPLGPVFSERAETVGKHKLGLALNYTLVQYDTINGYDLDNLTSNDPNGPGDHIAVCASPTLCEPVLGSAHIDLEAQIVSLSVTYGLASNLDVNLVLPLVRTYLSTSTTFTGPDPRATSDPRYFPFSFADHASEASTGIGDLLLRAKYLITHGGPADVAGGLALSIPTGDRQDFQGTGDTLVGLALYASHTYAERVEPHLNLTFVLDADKFDRSQVRYSAGADVRLFDWLTLNNDFLGRSDVTQPDAIDQPVFLQIERTDVFQFSTGLKLAPSGGFHVGTHSARATSFFNALLPLNGENLRSDLIIAFGVEVVF
jgi:hypothetical protein